MQAQSPLFNLLYKDFCVDISHLECAYKGTFVYDWCIRGLVINKTIIPCQVVVDLPLQNTIISTFDNIQLLFKFSVFRCSMTQHTLAWSVSHSLTIFVIFLFSGS